MADYLPAYRALHAALDFARIFLPFDSDDYSIFSEGLRDLAHLSGETDPIDWDVPFGNPAVTHRRVIVLPDRDRATAGRNAIRALEWVRDNLPWDGPDSPSVAFTDGVNPTISEFQDNVHELDFPSAPTAQTDTPQQEQKMDNDDIGRVVITITYSKSKMRWLRNWLIISAIAFAIVYPIVLAIRYLVF